MCSNSNLRERFGRSLSLSTISLRYGLGETRGLERVEHSERNWIILYHKMSLFFPSCWHLFLLFSCRFEAFSCKQFFLTIFLCLDGGANMDRVIMVLKAIDAG